MKILKYLTKGYMKETVLSPLFKCIEAVLELFVPIVVANIIDNGIAAGDKGYIIAMCAVLVGLGLAGLAFSITAQYFAAKAATGFSKTVGNALFRHIKSFSYSDYDEIGTSTLITRMTSDLGQVQTGVNMTLRLVLRSPFIVFGAMIMAFTIDVGSALIFAAIIPVLLAVVFGIMLGGMPLYAKVRASLDRLLGRTRENLSVEIKADGSTFSSAYAIDCDALPAGVKAYKVTKMTASEVTASEVTGQVAENTGLILVADAAGKYDIPVVASGVAVEGNLLKAAVAATEVAADKAYGLKGGKFHKLNAGTIPAGKAYLLTDDITSAPELSIVFGGEATGIADVRGKMEDVRSDFFDLQGRKVAQPAKGLYIQNGRKVILK